MSAIGTWKLTIQSPMGTQHPTATFTETPAGMVGTLTSPTGETGTVEGLTADGDTLSWKANVTGPMGAMLLAFTATVEGDSLTGKVTTPMGSIDLTGERQA